MSHVVGTRSAQVGPLQEQVREPVQAQAGCEGADETVEAPERDADGPADDEQHHQPDDTPEARAAVGHPCLGSRERARHTKKEVEQSESRENTS